MFPKRLLAGTLFEWRDTENKSEYYCMILYLHDVLHCCNELSGLLSFCKPEKIQISQDTISDCYINVVNGPIKKEKKKRTNINLILVVVTIASKSIRDFSFFYFKNYCNINLLFLFYF